MSPATSEKKDSRRETDIALLRVLTDVTESLTVTAIAGLTGLSLRLLRPALNRLRRLDLVSRVRAGKHSAWLRSIVK